MEDANCFWRRISLSAILLILQQSSLLIDDGSLYVSALSLPSTSSISSRRITNKEVTFQQEPDMEAYSNGFQSVTQELSHMNTVVESLPDDLVGTYYRSGPAMFTAGSIPPQGYSAVNPKEKPVADDDVAVNNPGNDYPLPMYRHHLQPGLNKKRRNTSNTRSVFWGKRLLTMWEGGLPHKIDALSLSTTGKSQLGGVLPEDAPFSGKAAYDANLDRMLFYSNVQDSGSSELRVFEFDNKFKLVGNKDEQQSHKLEGLALLNDFAVTKNYSIFVKPPVETNMFPFMMSKDPSKSAKLDQNGQSSLYIVPRTGVGSPLKSVPIPVDNEASDVDLHFCNAYEEGKFIVFDAIRSNVSEKRKSFSVWPWASSLGDYSNCVSKKSLWRYRYNLTTDTVEKELLCDTDCNFGVINPEYSAKKHRYIYANVGGLGKDVAPPQGIAKLDCESKTIEQWIPEPHEFSGEPMFARKNNVEGTDVNEDEGYILSILFNGKKNESEMIVLNAQDVKSGPIARIPLGIGIPHGLFGCFVSDEMASWSADELERRAKLAEKMEKKGNRWNEVKSDFSGLGLRLDDFDEVFGDLL